jgi:hypothetical protein
MGRQYKNLDEFYPFYLSQHCNRTCRRFHFVGTLIASLLLFYTLAIQFAIGLLILVPIIGYGCSWTGHFFFERNKPAAFQYPLLSFLGDLRLCSEILLGRRPF